MLKKNAWILALIAALALSFVGCGGDGPSGEGDVTDGMTSIMRGADGLPHYVNASGSPTVTNTAGGIVVTNIVNDYDGITITSQAGGGSAPTAWTAGQKFVVRGKVDSVASGTVQMVLQGSGGGYNIRDSKNGLSAGGTFEFVFEITAANVASVTSDGNLTVRGNSNELVGGGFTITGIWVK